MGKLVGMQVCKVVKDCALGGFDQPVELTRMRKQAKARRRRRRHSNSFLTVDKATPTHKVANPVRRS